jgi:glycerol-3-phosphate dehydrogenase
VAGGKWTTYRQMAEDTVDAAEKALNVRHRPCVTEKVLLVGAHAYTDTLKIRLIQQFGLEVPVAEHLARSYGDRAFDVAALARPTGKRWPPVGKRLANSYPYIGK